MPDLAPGADPGLQALVDQVKANPLGPGPTHVSPNREYNQNWRQRIQLKGGHVTNIALSPEAWQRVQEVRQKGVSAGRNAHAISELIAGSFAGREAIEQARLILAEYPDMGTLEEVLRVSVAHLLWKIRQDDDYVIALE
jgi:hypothetical protein